MKFIKVPLAAAILLLTACSTVSDDQSEVRLREFTEQDTTAGAGAAEKFAAGFFKALETKEFSHWKKVMPARETAKIGEKEFKQMYNELYTAFGDYESSAYLGELTVGDLKNHLWKMRFARKEKDKKITREVVFYVRVYCEENQPPDVSGFGVKLF